MNNQKLIRNAYKVYLPEIMEAKGRISPYFIDWIKYMTPIEYNVWSDIRSLGLTFFPQFPILKYFVDFADPINKIAIEVDSKKWHTDEEKDKKRQKEIEKLGWTFIRFNSKQTYYDYGILEEFYDNFSEDELEENTAFKYTMDLYKNSSYYILKELKNKLSEKYV
jgi:very-short-patch-repair endonuclease